VDFEVTADQAALQEAVRSFCAAKVPLARVRDLAGEPGAVDRGLWQELASLGVFGLRLPEARGGAGLGWADAVLVFEELGRALVPGPLVWSHLASAAVPGAADGGTVVAGLDRGTEPALVEHLDAADRVVVLDGDAASVVERAALGGTPVDPLDPLVPVHVLDGVPGGEPAGDAREWRAGGTVLTAGYLLGVAEGALDLAVAYAGERHQFGRPIGSFQAVKHLLADVVVAVEVARAAAYAAGVTLDQPDVGPPARAAAAAKLTAADAALAAGRACVQVHGGMGYTWEVDAHLFLKRAYAMEPLFGSRDDHADAVAATLAAGS
jgi:alkylation response protein AidB-like acyl-CoA dehydrogenase